MPIASSAAPTCEPRIVVRYNGAHIADLGSHLEIVFDSEPKRGLSWCLHDAGWIKQPGGAFRKPSTPIAIMRAQELVGEFYGVPLP